MKASLWTCRKRHSGARWLSRRSRCLQRCLSTAAPLRHIRRQPCTALQACPACQASLQGRPLHRPWYSLSNTLAAFGRPPVIVGRMKSSQPELHVIKALDCSKMHTEASDALRRRSLRCLQAPQQYGTPQQHPGELPSQNPFSGGSQPPQQYPQV